MLTIARIATGIATGIATFIIVFLVLFMGSLIIGGAVAGASSYDPAKSQSSYETGREAGEKFGRTYSGIIFLSSVGVGGLLAIAIPLSGLVPWCNKPTSIIPPPPGKKAFHIAKDGQDLGERDVSEIKKMLLNGDLTLNDYYFDPSRNEWLTLEGNADLSR